MASEQLIKKTRDREAGELPQVTHYESLTVKNSGDQPSVVHRVVETIQGAAGTGVQDQGRTQKSGTASARYVEQQQQQQQQTADQVRKNQLGPISTTTNVQPKKNIFGGSQSAAMEKASEQITSHEQTKKQHAGAKGEQTTKETIGGLTDVGKKGATYVGEMAVETAEYARQAAGVAKDTAAKAASGAAEFATGVTESVEDLNAGVSGLIDNTAEVAAGTAIGFADTVKDVGKKGAGYIGQKAVAGKDITLDTGKKAAGYVGKGLCVAEEGVRESMESLNAGVAKAVEGTAAAAESVTGKAMGLTETTVGAGKKGATYIGETIGRGKDVSLQIGKTTIHNVGKGACLAEEGVRESMETLNVGVAKAVEDTAVAAESVTEKAMGLTETTVDAGKKGATYIGETIGRGKDISLQVGKTTARTAAGAVKDATLVGGWTAAELASGAATGVTESMETLNEGVAQLLESTTLATEDVARKTINTMVDVGKKGASYIGEKVVAGKDITLETGKATTEYVGKGASVVKDAALVGGWSALELASDTTKGVSESMINVNEGVEGLVENAAIVAEGAAGELKDVAVDVCKRGGSYMVEKGVEGKDTTLNMGKTTLEYAGKVADMVKDATLVAGRSAAEVASGTTGGVTESMENLNAGVAGLVEATAWATEDVAQKTIDTMADVGKKGASYVGGMASATLAAGRGATEFDTDTAVESKENWTTKPKKTVIEKEEITTNYGQTRKT